ncbi:MAG: Fe-S-cluster containining protein [Saprospiraceae bacterium]|jgi:Fe-S-cluster containining protein
MLPIKPPTQSQLKENKLLLKKIKKLKPSAIDSLFHQAHDKVFSCTDCLDCANCCKTTGPLFTQKDIERISKHLRLKPKDFIGKYLRVDEDSDHVLQSVPCTFLGVDNYCSIYDVRPKACREYPHTDRVKQKQLLNLNLKNTEVCPAVQEIFSVLQVQIKTNQ